MPRRKPREGGDTAVATEKKTRTDRPRLWRVLLHNDDFTTMEFVVKVLMESFNKSAAKARRHEHVTLEHLLYALLRDPVAARILRACGARLPELRRELEQHLDESQPSLPRGADREPEHTQAFKRVLERAALQVQSSGKEQIDGGNVLVAFYRERDSHAVYLLERQGITRLDLLRYISHGALKVRDPSAMRQYQEGEPGSQREQHAP